MIKRIWAHQTDLLTSELESTIRNSCAHLQAEITMRVRTSTHTVFFGRVLSARSTEEEPLVYLGSEFFDGARLEKLQA